MVDSGSDFIKSLASRAFLLLVVIVTATPERKQSHGKGAPITLSYQVRGADIQTYRHTDIQTYRHTDIQTCRHADMQTCRHADMHTCIHAYMHTYMHACIYAYTRIHT